VAGGDLMYHADIVASNTFEVFNIYIFIGLIYLILTIPLSIGVNQLHYKLSRRYGGEV
jgi:putative glutamine transport system permease protein